MKRSGFLLDNVLFFSSALLPIIVSVYLDIHFSTFSTNVKGVVTGSLAGTALNSFLNIFWLISIAMALLWLFTIFRYGSPLRSDAENIKRLRKEGWDQHQKLLLTYVTRGENWEALKGALKATVPLLEEIGVNYQVEIVTNKRIESKVGSYPNTRYYLVPKEYETSNVSRYKARSLHYMVEQRDAWLSDLENTWILHMDEESILTKEGLAGIHKFVTEPANQRAVGQGEIKYNSGVYGKNILTTAMDTKRTGDDLTRFRFQYGIAKMPLFGVHGSYLLIPATIEQEIGFDMGDKASITEDIYFAMHCWAKGVKFKWIEGFVKEQPPLGCRDILKQRRRWFCGLRILALDPQVTLTHRLCVIYNVVFWIISTVIPFYLVVRLVLAAHLPATAASVPPALIGLFSLRTVAPNYMVGAYRNLLDVEFSLLHKIGLYAVIVLLMPVSVLIEGSAVVYALLRPVRTFEVVRKV